MTVSAAAVSPALAADFTLGGSALSIAAGSTVSTGTVTISAVDNSVDALDKTRDGLGGGRQQPGDNSAVRTRPWPSPMTTPPRPR